MQLVLFEVQKSSFRYRMISMSHLVLFIKEEYSKGLILELP